MNVIKIFKEKVFKCGYVQRDELWESPSINDSPIRIKCAYTPNGDWIGDVQTAHRLVYKRGIQPQKINPEHCICSIGYSIKNGKWYGWSHRAIYGFKIGSKCRKGDCHYMPKDKGGKGEWIAKTMADAKQMAIDFAKSVS